MMMIANGKLHSDNESLQAGENFENLEVNGNDDNGDNDDEEQGNRWGNL